MTVAPDDLELIGKCLKKLSDENPNEVVAAATAMISVLKKTGHDIHDLWQQLNESDDGLRKQALLLFEENDKLRAQLALKKKESAKDVDALIKIGKEHSSFFCNDAAYAIVVVNGQRKTYKVESKPYANWLRYEFRLVQEKAATGSEIKTAILQLAADAEFEPLTPRHSVQLRTAEANGCIYLDLCDDLGQCIEVNDTGWGLVEPPEQVQFRRTGNMRPLPIPVRGGSIELLRPFTNLTDGDFVLFVAVLLDAFRSGKHPILNLVGEFATAKSTLAKIFKKLTDPDETELRALPGTVEDMFVAVDNARVRAWDNISKITPTMSNALCELSDGSGYGRRKRYTDGDEYRVQGSRTIILTSLVNCATRPDLSSRTVMLKLQPIKEEARRSEVELWARFDEACPLILGALLDALAFGLKTLPTIKLDKLDRLPDFQLFGHACEGAYAPAGSFAAAFSANKTELNEALIEEDAVATAIMAFMPKRPVWTGTTTALMAELTSHDRTEQKVSKQRDWPPDAIRFSHRLRAIAATLRKAGIEVAFGNAPDRNKTRMITLQNIGRSDVADDTDVKKKSRSHPKGKRKGKPSKKKRTSERPNVRKRAKGK